jgi:repressor LexA|nr:MAG TPA: Repressor protein CI [Caudoviricetes sp.]
MSIGSRIKERRELLNLSQEELALKLGYKSRSTINKIESGINDITQSKVVEFAKVLQTTPAYLMGWEDLEQKKTDQKNISLKSNISAVYADNIHMIPVFESVSAGFGAYASSNILEYTPIYIPCQYEAENTICIVVTGDSMYPKIESGDIIQVYKQDSVDSGSIAVVLLDDDEGLVKKVYYGDDWIELHSINPMYPVMRFEKEDVTRLRVVGLVRKIIKNCD